MEKVYLTLGDLRYIIYTQKSLRENHKNTSKWSDFLCLQHILQFIFPSWSVSSRSHNKIEYMKAETFQGENVLEYFSFRN